MKLNFSALLELIFPLSDDERCIARSTPARFSKKLSPSHDDGVYALTHFKDAQVRAAIHLIKFHHHPHALSLVSELLAVWLLALVHEEYLLIPIPLSAQRRQKRGYNQVESIASSALTRVPHITLCPHALERVRHTDPQTSLTREERLQNLIGAFRVPSAHHEVIRGRHLILLDDVSTTGTTLKGARDVLKAHHPASVLCVAIAH